MNIQLIKRRLRALTTTYQRHQFRYWTWPSRMGGCSRCWRLGSSDNAPRHATEYYRGQYGDSSACIPLCEDCWTALTPITRMPYYIDMLRNWAWREDVDDVTKIADEACFNIIIAVLEGK